jgi:predicted PurR-regulated permease PerM
MRMRPLHGEGAIIKGTARRLLTRADLSSASTALFIRQTLIVLGLVVLALLLWRIAYALLLAFGGVLFAVFLRGLAAKVAAWTHLHIRWALLLVVIALIAPLVVTGILIGPTLAEQLGQLGAAITKGVERLRTQLEQTPLGQQAIEMMTDGVQDGGQLLGAAGTIFRGVADMLVALALILVAGIFFAANPRLYVEGAVALVPYARQRRARELLEAIGNALWMWLIGQFVQMLAVGVLTAIGLLIVGVPLALALGLITGLLDFVPFIGPIVAAIPILLVALTADFQTALYAGLVFLAIQQLENNLLTPLVQRWAVSLPPVLVLVSTIVFALLFGLIGVIFATPLLVVVMVCVKMLYMEDVLGERVDVPGTPAK